MEVCTNGEQGRVVCGNQESVTRRSKRLDMQHECSQCPLVQARIRLIEENNGWVICDHGRNQTSEYSDLSCLPT